MPTPALMLDSVETESLAALEQTVIAQQALGWNRDGASLKLERELLLPAVAKPNELEEAPAFQ